MFAQTRRRGENINVMLEVSVCVCVQSCACFAHINIFQKWSWRKVILITTQITWWKVLRHYLIARALCGSGCMQPSDCRGEKLLLLFIRREMGNEIYFNDFLCHPPLKYYSYSWSGSTYGMPRTHTFTTCCAIKPNTPSKQTKTFSRVIKI